jgi:AcrR family transcriptional regulator
LSAQDPTRKLLAHIAVRMGGVDQIAKRLKLSARVVRLYIEGKEQIPDALVLRAVDLILDELDGLKSAPSRSQPGALFRQDPQSGQ